MAEMNPARDAWLAALELLRMQGDLSDSQSAFVRMAHPLATAEDIFMIVVGSEFVKNWIEEHVADLMTGALSNILGHSIRLVISIDPSVNESPLPAAERRESRPVETARRRAAWKLPPLFPRIRNGISPLPIGISPWKNRELIPMCPLSRWPQLRRRPVLPARNRTGRKN